MPLEPQTLEIMLGGLEQKKSELTRTPGSLERARNVEFDKTGMLNKRRGYRYVAVGSTNVVSRFLDTDDVFHRVTSYRDELVIFSYDYVISLLSPAGAVRTGDTVAYRGPCNRGALKIEHATSGTHTQNAGSG